MDHEYNEPRRRRRRRRHPHILDVSVMCGFARLRPREISIRNAVTAFRELEGWTEKLENREFVAEWLLRRSEDEEEPHGWGRDEVTFWYEEMKNYQNFFRGRGFKGLEGVEPVDGGVWRKDGDAVDGELLRELADVLNTIDYDYEPKPDASINNMTSTERLSRSSLPSTVDPSMYPVVYGKTISSVSEPAKVSAPASLSTYNGRYRKLSNWLPTPFQISRSGKVKITSYINNLSRPGDAEKFHPLIERAFETFVPLFNLALVENEEGRWRAPTQIKYRRRIRTEKEFMNKNVRFSTVRGWWYQPKLYASRADHKLVYERLLQRFKENKEMDVDLVDELGKPKSKVRDVNKKDRLMIHDRWVLLPGTAWRAPDVGEGNMLEGTTAKVFVRVVDIKVSPGEEGWSGGRWRVDGSLNERIIATGVFCYSQENVTAVKLGLRRRCFSHRHDAGSYQEIPPVPLKKNRAVVYNNAYERTILPFRAVDKTKPGHCKILMFHICDPDHSILTTRDIVPQQPGLYEKILRASGLGSLPEDVFVIIKNNLCLPGEALARLAEEEESYPELRDGSHGYYGKPDKWGGESTEEEDQDQDESEDDGIEETRAVALSDTGLWSHTSPPPALPLPFRRPRSNDGEGYLLPGFNGPPPPPPPPLPSNSYLSLRPPPPRVPILLLYHTISRFLVPPRPPRRPLFPRPPQLPPPPPISGGYTPPGFNGPPPPPPPPLPSNSYLSLRPPPPQEEDEKEGL